MTNKGIHSVTLTAVKMSKTSFSSFIGTKNISLHKGPDMWRPDKILNPCDNE